MRLPITDLNEKKVIFEVVSLHSVVKNLIERYEHIYIFRAPIVSRPMTQFSTEKRTLCWNFLFAFEDVVDPLLVERK